jgi:hypothetical protein
MDNYLSELFKLDQAKTVRDYHIDTDEWLTYGKFALGGNNRTA